MFEGLSLGTVLNDHGTQAVNNLQNLRLLALNGNKVGDDTPAAVGRLTKRLNKRPCGASN